MPCSSRPPAVRKPVRFGHGSQVIAGSCLSALGLWRKVHAPLRPTCITFGGTMPDYSLRETGRLLRYAQGAVLVRAGLSLAAFLLASLVALTVEFAVNAVVPGNAGAILGFIGALVCLALVLFAFELAPLAAFAAAPLVAMAMACQAPRPDRVDAGQARARALGNGSTAALHRLRNQFLGTTRDVFGLVQGLPQALPKSGRLPRGAHRLWLSRTAPVLADVASAEVLLASARARGPLAQQAAIRFADVARPLVSLAAWPVVWVAVLTLAVMVLVWPLCFSMVRAVPGGVDSLTSLALAACFALWAARSLGQAFVIAAILPTSLTMLHAEAPNMNWTARLGASSPAWRALGGAGGVSDTADATPSQRLSPGDPPT